MERLGRSQNGTNKWRFARKEFDEASDWFWLSDVPTVDAESIYAIGITKRKKEELPVMTAAGAGRRITDWAGRCYACGVVGHTKGDTVCKLDS